MTASTASSIVKELSVIDRFLPVWIFAAMALGIGLTEAAPRLLAPELAAGVSLLVTMGCGEACPFVPGARREDWPLPDPKGQPLERVRQVRDRVLARVVALVQHHHQQQKGAAR